MARLTLAAMAFLALPLLAACGGEPPPPAAEALVGPYRLMAREDPAHRSICVQREDACVRDVLPGPTLAAVGYDQRHLVIVNRPPGGGAEQYYFVVRHPEEQSALGADNVHGPMTAEEFAVQQTRLRLPQVSQQFD